MGNRGLYIIAMAFSPADDVIAATENRKPVKL